MTPRMQTSTTETRTCGAGLRSTTDTSEQARHTTGALETEVRTMQLSELLDLGTKAQQVGETVPCRDYDAELVVCRAARGRRVRQDPVRALPRAAAVPRRGARAAGAVGCVGRAAARPGGRGRQEATAGTSAQAPGRGLNDTGP